MANSTIKKPLTCVTGAIPASGSASIPNIKDGDIYIVTRTDKGVAVLGVALLGVNPLITDTHITASISSGTLTLTNSANYVVYYAIYRV